MEKRKFSRTGFHTDGEVVVNETRLAVSIVDLSLKGALFISETEIPGDETVELIIHLSNSELSISAFGKIVHRQDNRYGIRFSSIDAESMIHLRSLMEYNTENYERIGSELAFLYHTEETQND